MFVFFSYQIPQMVFFSAEIFRFVELKSSILSHKLFLFLRQSQRGTLRGLKIFLNTFGLNQI